MKRRKLFAIIAIMIVAVVLIFSVLILTRVQIYSFQEVISPQQMIHPSGSNVIFFNDSHNASIFGFYFNGRIVRNGTELNFGLGVTLWHAKGTAVSSLIIDMNPLPSCNCNISLGPSGMGYQGYRNSQLTVQFTNESKYVSLEITNFYLYGMLQNFSFGTGVDFLGNPPLPLSLLLSISVVLYKTWSLSLGNLVIYNGTSPIIGTNYYGSTNLTVTS